jgi:hypothetical protein
MRAESGEVLSAFVDGESFEPSEVAAVLAEPGARDMLVDFVLLRRAVEAGEEPSPEFVSEMRARLRPRRVPRGLRLLAAAAVVMLAVLGALDLGGLGWSVPTKDAPPAASRELRFDPGVDWHVVETR